MKKITLTLLALVMALCCAFGLAACGDNDGGDTVAVTNITLNKTELTLEIDDEETLTATVTPDNATNKTVSWSSDKPEIASVANGKVTAVAVGTAVITATADGKSATCTVKVNEGSSEVSLVGKTFVFLKTECDVWDADRIAMSDASNAGSTITFDTETTATALAYDGMMVQMFTYTFEDNEIKMTITEMTMNGELVDISLIPVTTFVLDGDYLVSVQRANEEGHYVYMTYVLQTAE